MRRLIPDRPGISRCENPSAANARTRAQSNASSTSRPPRLDPTPTGRACEPSQSDHSQRELCTIRSPTTVQYWAPRVSNDESLHARRLDDRTSAARMMFVVWRPFRRLGDGDRFLRFALGAAERIADRLEARGCYLSLAIRAL